MLVKPRVTVIIPTYNRAYKVLDAINSVVNQTYPNIQILVIDDGSTDQTQSLVSSLTQVQYIRQDHRGQAAARNNGLQHSDGSIIANLDSDDTWNPEFLSLCVEKLEKEQLDFVFANWTQEHKNGEEFDFLINDPFLKPFFNRSADGWIDLENGDLRRLYLSACPSPSSSVVLRKSSIVTGWNEQINIGDDWALYIDMILAKECKVAFTLQKLWRKRVDAMNIFDGRKRSEILDLLYVSDVKGIKEQHKNRLSAEELKILEYIYINGLVELSKHKLVREFNILPSLRLFVSSCLISWPLTVKATYNVFLKAMFIRFNRPHSIQKV